MVIHILMNSKFFYIEENGVKRPTNVAYITPSVTPFTNTNPSFRIYTYDVASKFLVDTDTYFTNLTAANSNGAPTWGHEYSAKSAYGMDQLFPADWDSLIGKFQQNLTLFQSFSNYHRSMASTAPCTGDCMKDSICGMKSASVVDYQACMKAEGLEGYNRVRSC